MARLSREAGKVPADLRTFVARRWIKAALDDGDSRLASLARHLTRAQVYGHWYAVNIVAPARYRAALWESIGERDGEVVYVEVMESPKVHEQILRVIANATT